MTDLIFENGTLTLSAHGKPFLRFSPGDEFAAVGKGESTYSMSHGSFRIKEKIRNREALTVSAIDFRENKAVITLNKGTALIEKAAGDTYRFSFEGLDGYNRLWFSLPSGKNEGVYGCGEIFPQFNLKGQKVNAWVAEHVNALQIAKKLVKMALGQENATRKQKFSKYETYYAQPTFLSSEKYFFHSEATARTQFDFRKDNVHIIQTDSVSPFTLGFGDSFEEVMASLTRLTRWYRM